MCARGKCSGRGAVHCERPEDEVGDQRPSREGTRYSSTRSHYDSHTRREKGGARRHAWAWSRNYSIDGVRLLDLLRRSRLAKVRSHSSAIYTGRLHFPARSLFSLLLLLHSLYYRLPSRTLSPSGDHQLASTSRSRSTRSETAHETRDTQPESSGPSVFTRAQQLSQSPEIIQKGLVMEGADLGSDYKAVRINADLPVLHTGSENTSSRRRTPSR